MTNDALVLKRLEESDSRLSESDAPNSSPDENSAPTITKSKVNGVSESAVNGKHKPLASETLIRSRERVRDLGEVFTPSDIIKLMLELIPHDFWDYHEKCCLDPACGDGRFLMAILELKMKALNDLDLEGAEYHYAVLIVLSRIYGVDIDEQNVIEARHNMLGSLGKWYKGRLPHSVRWAAEIILESTITKGDFLKSDFYLTQWVPKDGAGFERWIYRAKDIFPTEISNKGDELDFSDRLPHPIPIIGEYIPTWRRMKPMMEAESPKENEAPFDLLDTIAHLSSDEIFTSSKAAKDMLDLLPKEVWENPDLRWLNPSTKGGMILREIAKRLMIGLEKKILDREKRNEHIFKNMLYGIAITDLTAKISRRSLYCSMDASNKRTYDLIGTRFDDPQGNIWYEDLDHNWNKKGKCKDCGISKRAMEQSTNQENHAYGFLHKDLKDLFPKLTFDIIIANPPYQLSDKGGANESSATPLYHHFVNMGKKYAKRYVIMVTPARWYAGGKGLNQYREEMLHDTRLAKLVDFHDSSLVFHDVDVAGGISYFLWDKEHDEKCEVIPTTRNGRVEHTNGVKRWLNEYDIFIRDNEALSILEKVRTKSDKWLNKKVLPRNPFNYNTNLQSFDNKKGKGKIAIYHRNGQGWIKENKILPNWKKDKERATERNARINQWKVIVSKTTSDHAGRAGNDGTRRILSKIEILPPSSCCTETYLVAGMFKTKTEAKNYYTYLKTRFVRFLIGLRVNTQNTTSESYTFVPDLPMNRVWTDEDLYEWAKLTDEEIEFIESRIKAMS